MVVKSVSLKRTVTLERLKFDRIKVTNTSIVERLYGHCFGRPPTFTSQII